MKMMKKCAAAAAMFLAANAALASKSCEDFLITIKNKLDDSLLLQEATLTGADLSPSRIDKIDPGSAITFTVQKPSGGLFLNRMQGEFELKTIGIRSKSVRITYSLADFPGICRHNDKTDEAFTSGLKVNKSRTYGRTIYTIEDVE